MKTSNKKLPSFIKPYLWSYDTDKMDFKEDKRRILTNVLNLGTKEATDWVFKEYNRSDIVEVIKKPLPGEWDKKSLYFWSLVLGVKPGSTKRKVS